TVAGVWLAADDHRQWVTASSRAPAGAALAAVGDPRHHASLHPAVRGGRPLRLGAGAGEGPPDAELAAALAGLESVVAVPVPGADAANHGVIVAAAAGEGRFTAENEDDLAVLGCHLGVAVDNLEDRRALEELRATEQQMVNQLQAAVVPERPVVANTELGSFYSPADPGVATGGDLHDWIVLPDGDLHVAVVDVMGKGVAATKDALAVTHALRLLVLDGCPLDDVVRRADAIVTAQNPELVATLLVGRYRPATGELRLAGGGHPPAFVVQDGRAREVTAPGVPIGWPGAGSEAVAEVTLGRTDSFVLYTDGLVEGTKDVVTGLASLRRFAEETAPYPAPQQARILVERTLAGAARRDDSLALIVRRRMPPPPAGASALGPFEHRLSHSMAAVSVSRGLLREWLVRVPVDADAIHDLLLAATELCANAVEHATWQGEGVVLRARTEGADVILDVEDDGGGLNWPIFALEPPDPRAEHGRGLWLVRTFTDEVTPETSGDRTRIRCVKRAVVAAPASPAAGERGASPRLARP
ncbi:MAG TPA: SpoIIE family protein phosphatase, partial [Acidimicrobiales bacterium]|nr:SpoIIE family protein phosphatase [Acidimicrobiales bacterium]